MIDLKLIGATDPEVAEAMRQELGRQRDHLELIASENFVSPAVLAAAGSHLTNKYAEGYPGRRYYGGCEHVDVVENLARDRAKEVFGAKYANVQPHAGAQANAAVGRTEETQYITEEYLAELETEMHAAAENLEFERAAALRDRIVKMRDAIGQAVDSVAAKDNDERGGRRRGRKGAGARVPRPKRSA